MADKITSLLFNVGAAFSIGTLLGKNCIYTVDPGEKAIIFDKFKGLQDKIIGEGMHFYIPFV